MIEKRRSPRRISTALGLRGYMALVHKLHAEAVRQILKECDAPQPHVIEVAARDISENGGGVQVEIISAMSDEERLELSDLVDELKASLKMDIQPLPILLIFKEAVSGRTMGVPAVVRNIRHDNRVGLQISEGSYARFARLAEMGKEYFRGKFAELVALEAEEARFQMDMGSIPPEVKARTGECVVTWMAKGGGLPDELSSKFDARKRLMSIFIHFLAGKGKTHEFWSSLAETLADKKGGDCEMTVIGVVERLFSQEEKDEFWGIVKSECAPKAPAAKPQAKPSDAPSASWEGLPKPRKDYLARACEKFIVEGKTLEIIIDTFIGDFLPSDAELKTFLSANPDFMIGRKKKTTVNIWFRSACQARRRDIDSLFKQAIYETIKKRDPALKNFRLDPTDREDLLNGKLKNSSMDDFANIEDRFYKGVCKTIKASVLDTFRSYKEKNDEETQRKEKDKKEKGKVSEMSREDLLARHLLEKALQLKILNLNEVKKAALGLVGNDDYRHIVGAGGVVALNSGYFEELDMLSGGKLSKSSLFVEIDLVAMYNAKEKTHDGKEMKGTFGVFVDSLKPDDLREAILTKVLTPAYVWNKVYIIKAGQSTLESFFGDRFFAALKIIKERMLRMNPEDSGVV